MAARDAGGTRRSEQRTEAPSRPRRRARRTNLDFPTAAGHNHNSNSAPDPNAHSGQCRGSALTAVVDEQLRIPGGRRGPMSDGCGGREASGPTPRCCQQMCATRGWWRRTRNTWRLPRDTAVSPTSSVDNQATPVLTSRWVDIKGRMMLVVEELAHVLVTRGQMVLAQGNRDTPPQNLCREVIPDSVPWYSRGEWVERCANDLLPTRSPTPAGPFDDAIWWTMQVTLTAGVLAGIGWVLWKMFAGENSQTATAPQRPVTTSHLPATTQQRRVPASQGPAVDSERPVRPPSGPRPAVCERCGVRGERTKGPRPRLTCTACGFAETGPQPFDRPSELTVTVRCPHCSGMAWETKGSERAAGCTHCCYSE